MNYDMIIFDIDGTLWNVAELTLKAANIAASRYDGVRYVSLNDINNVMGLGASEIAEKLYSEIDFHKALEVVKTSINVAAELIDKKGGNIYDGVNDTIKYLSEKYKLAIVTNNTDGYAKLFLNKSGLNDFFEDYIGATTYNITKAEAMKKIIDKNNISSACYIGDIKKDMLAAEEAGIDFIHAKYGFEKNLKTDTYINDIKDLKKIL